MKKHKRGFTLAEVLITLVIIGIIAAMTIPTLMNKTNEQETVVAVKKAYSTISQAYQRMVADYGELNPSFFGSTDVECTKNIGDLFAKYLSVQKNCGLTTDGDCWSTQNGGMYKFFDGSDWINWNTNNTQYRMSLSNGYSLSVFSLPEYRNRGQSLEYVFGAFFVDINGDKAPNTLGKDVFAFWIMKNGILPYGLPAQEEEMYKLSSCKTTGRGCTAWVVTKGNMDYLRKDVSW